MPISVETQNTPQGFKLRKRVRLEVLLIRDLLILQEPEKLFNYRNRQPVSIMPKSTYSALIIIRSQISRLN